jgi:hypothetical protein
MQLMVLPPQGRKYGFPKIYNGKQPMNAWLLENGYPKALINPNLKLHTWDASEWSDNPLE